MRFRKKSKPNDFGPITPVPNFEQNKNFPKTSKTAIFNHFLIPTFSYNFKKIQEEI